MDNSKLIIKYIRADTKPKFNKSATRKLGLDNDYLITDKNNNTYKLSLYASSKKIIGVVLAVEPGIIGVCRVSPKGNFSKKSMIKEALACAERFKMGKVLYILLNKTSMNNNQPFAYIEQTYNIDKTFYDAFLDVLERSKK